MSIVIAITFLIALAALWLTFVLISAGERLMDIVTRLEHEALAAEQSGNLARKREIDYILQLLAFGMEDPNAFDAGEEIEEIDEAV